MKIHNRDYVYQRVKHKARLASNEMFPSKMNPVVYYKRILEFIGEDINNLDIKVETRITSDKYRIKCLKSGNQYEGAYFKMHNICSNLQKLFA